MNAGAKLLIFKEIGKCLPYKLIMEICLRKLSVVLKVVGKYDSKRETQPERASLKLLMNLCVVCNSFQNEPAFSNPLARVID